jgi:hypothetical protein
MDDVISTSRAVQTGLAGWEVDLESLTAAFPMVTHLKHVIFGLVSHEEEDYLLHMVLPKSSFLRPPG